MTFEGLFSPPKISRCVLGVRTTFLLSFDLLPIVRRLQFLPVIGPHLSRLREWNDESCVQVSLDNTESLTDRGHSRVC